MEGFLNAEHWKVSNLIDELMSCAIERRSLQIIEMLKPVLSKDGNKFCFLYGQLPNDCVVGFGDTVFLAMQDFCNSFFSSKAIAA